MSELIERLRAGNGGGKEWMELHKEAADEIERLREKLRHADPMAACMSYIRDELVRAGIIGSDVPPMFYPEAIGQIARERDALRARIDGAPVGTLHSSLAKSDLRDLDAGALNLNGKRVALVVLE